MGSAPSQHKMQRRALRGRAGQISLRVTGRGFETWYLTWFEHRPAENTDIQERGYLDPGGEGVTHTYIIYIFPRVYY
jgi:hypothetical protein